jgi:RNA polymerase sigma-70 factor (ECF subfamily)
MDVSGATAPADAVAGDFAAFYTREHAMLFRVLVVLTRHRADAEDIAHEAFVRVLERWGEGRAIAQPRAYLYRVALNLRRNLVRRATRQAKRVIVGRASTEDFADTSVERVRLAQALSALTREQLEALVLTDVVGFTSAEAASVLGVRPDAIRARAHRGRTVLRQEMDDDA